MDRTRKTLFIAFSTQKGGVGKSTFTAIVASILHYRLGYNVAVFDCDYPQHSMVKMRERDLKAVMENAAYQKLAHRQFSTINKKAYPVIQHKAEGVLEAAKQFLDASPIEVDMILFDLPGTVNSSGILQTLSGMHYIFSPITADRVVVESTLSFSQVLTEVVMKQGETSIRKISLFWNQVDGREKSPLYEAYEKVIGHLGLTLMQSYITDSKRFRKEGETTVKTVLRSTLLPPDQQLMKVHKLDSFMSEFLKTVEL